MLNPNREKSVMRTLMTFFKIYVNFTTPETSHNFEKTIQAITHNTTTMGIEKLVISIKKAEGKAEASIETKVEIIQNLIIKPGLTDEQAADVAGVEIDFAKQIKRNLPQI